MSDNLALVIIILLCLSSCGEPDLIDAVRCNLYEPMCAEGAE